VNFEPVDGWGELPEGPKEFVAPHAVVTDSRGDLYVAEPAYTARGPHEAAPREIPSRQKFRRTG
jgi:hypothetical protein